MSMDDWLRRGKNYRGEEEVEYYEDTHNERGEYVGRQEYAQPQFSMPKFQTAPPFEPTGASGPMSLPDKNQFISPRLYQNVVVYEPRSPEDVQTLIDYLKRREPAIINLDNIETDVAQRVLDFVSGAIYALNGSVHRIAGNIFLLSPEGVEITVPYELNNNQR